MPASPIASGQGKDFVRTHPYGSLPPHPRNQSLSTTGTLDLSQVQPAAFGHELHFAASSDAHLLPQLLRNGCLAF